MWTDLKSHDCSKTHHPDVRQDQKLFLNSLEWLLMRGCIYMETCVFPSFITLLSPVTMLGQLFPHTCWVKLNEGWPSNTNVINDNTWLLLICFSCLAVCIITSLCSVILPVKQNFYMSSEEKTKRTRRWTELVPELPVIFFCVCKMSPHCLTY